MNKSQEAFEKKKSIPKCISMPLTECLDKNKEQNGVEEFDDYDIEENEMEEYMDNGSNHDSEEVEGTCANKAEGNSLGASSSGLIRKRGKTLCRKIHAREFKDRQEITLNEEGQPIGPDEKTVSELSSFLGTIGRSSDLCPLTFTSWIALVKFWEQHNIDPVWDYVNVINFFYLILCLLAYFNVYIYLNIYFCRKNTMFQRKEGRMYLLL